MKKEQSPRTAKVSIKDVARAAGVSVGTVSHYINGRAITKARSERIERAIKELGFSGNLLARGMRKQQSPVVGLCVPYTTFSNFSSLVDALDEKVSEASYEMMQVLSRQDSRHEFQRVQRLAAFKAVGLILVPSLQPEAMLDFLYEIQMPTVIVSRPLPGEARFDQVGVDHKRQMRQIGHEAIARGHRSILFVVRFPTLIVTRQRFEGLGEAIEQSGSDVALEMMPCGDDEAAYAALLQERLSRRDRPTMVIASNSRIAAWSLPHTRRKRRGAVPVALMTLDHPEWAEIVNPPVSHVVLPNREIADLAWQCLQNRIENPDSSPKRILLDAKVEWRG